MHVEHRRHRGRRSRRGAEQPGDAAVGARQHRGAELQHAALALGPPDHLHPLPGDGQFPVGIDCAGGEFAQRLRPDRPPTARSWPIR